MKKFSLNILFTMLAAFILLSAGCSKKEEVKPAEAPEEVVRKFYAYIKEGGTTTLGEAYRLCDVRQGKLSEDAFKNTVTQYPKEMDVKVVKTAIDQEKDRAIVTIEYKMASSFGGYITTQTDINLVLDKEARCWRIDFTGDSYDETPGMYTQGQPAS